MEQAADKQKRFSQTRSQRMTSYRELLLEIQSYQYTNTKYSLEKLMYKHRVFGTLKSRLPDLRGQVITLKRAEELYKQIVYGYYDVLKQRPEEEKKHRNSPTNQRTYTEQEQQERSLQDQKKSSDGYIAPSLFDFRNEMTLNDYQYKAMQTCLPSSANHCYMLFGLGEEVGELFGKISKAIRKNWIVINNNNIEFSENTPADFMELVTKEMGDVEWMITGLASQFKKSKEEICQQNIDKLADRQKRNVIDGQGDKR